MGLDEIEKLTAASMAEEKIYLREIQQKYLQTKKDLYAKDGKTATRAPAPVVEDLDSDEETNENTE